MSKKHKKVCTTGYITGYISISDFASLIGIPIGLTSSVIGLKFCAVTTGIKIYK